MRLIHDIHFSWELPLRMEPSISGKPGNVILLGGLLVAALGLVMWSSAGYLSGLGLVIAASACFMKSDAPAGRGAPAQRFPRYSGVVLLALGLASFALKIAGL